VLARLAFQLAHTRLEAAHILLQHLDVLRVKSFVPRLIERDAACSIHFYFANFEGMRASLFPLLDRAYRRWRETGSPDALRKAAEAGSAHWHEAAQRLLRVHQGDPAAAEKAIVDWIEDPGALAL